MIYYIVCSTCSWSFLLLEDRIFKYSILEFCNSLHPLDLIKLNYFTTSYDHNLSALSLLLTLKTPETIVFLCANAYFEFEIIINSLVSASFEYYVMGLRSLN